MNKKIISINLVIILVLTMFTNIVCATSGTDYIKIDGTINLIGKEASGDGWSIDKYGTLRLSDYNGGSIYSNVDLDVWATKSTITASVGEYGIYADGNLSIRSLGDEEITIIGADGKEALYATNNLYITSNIIAIGNNYPAISASTVDIDNYTLIYGGENESSLIGGRYVGEKYMKTVPIKYPFEHDVVLNGNGGVTLNDNSQYKIHLTVTTPTTLNLNAYTGSYDDNGIIYATGVFKNDNKLLLGWKGKDGDFLNLNSIKILPYEETTALHAYWEDEENKAIILKNCYNDTLNGETFIEPVKTNEKYVLPNMSRKGFIFGGWTSSGKLYKEGEEVVTDKTLVFTAQYRKPSTNPDFQNLIIGGKEYDPGNKSGSYALGWHYYPGDGHFFAQLNIFKNYSGEPIVVPCSVRIFVNGDVFGDEKNPAITVYGDAYVNGCSFNSVKNIEVVGYGEHPAIMVDGNLTIDGITGEDSFFIFEGGNDNTPAIKAKQIYFYDRFFFVGKNRETLKKANNYNNEHVTKFVPDGHNYYVEVSQNETVPTPQTHNNYNLVGWEVISNSEVYLPQNDSAKWYMPGENMDMPGETILKAAYISNNRSSVAIALHGNGGITANKSRHYITYASTHSLELYELPADKFVNDGYTFNGFNTQTDGTGKVYNNGDCLTDDGKTYVYNLYAQWKKNETSTPQPSHAPSGNGGGGGGGGAPSASNADITVGDKIVKATVSGTTATISKIDSLSSNDKEIAVDLSEMGKLVDTVKLSATVIKELVNTADITFKFDDVNILFDTTAIQAISNGIGNNQLSLKVSKATETTMNTSQKATVKELDNAMVYEFTLKVGSKVLSDFNGGKAEVEINVGKGREGQIKMYHISDNGAITDIDATYDKNTGIAKATLDHFSLYAITFDETVVEIPAFSDVNKEDWYYDSIMSISKLGLMNGTTETNFAPNDNLTRAMLVTILYRAENEPPVNNNTSFNDVDMGSYYANAVMWAKENGIVSGKTNNEFAPNENITREQVATIIYRYATYKTYDVSIGEDTSILSYKDYDAISEYAITPMRYSVGIGLISGKSDTTLNPLDKATRAEIATILQKFIEVNK